jgi:hypothetical protein
MVAEMLMTIGFLLFIERPTKLSRPPDACQYKLRRLPGLGQASHWPDRGFRPAVGEAEITNWGLVYKHQAHVIGMNIGALIQFASQIFGEVMGELFALIAAFGLAEESDGVTKSARKGTLGVVAHLSSRRRFITSTIVMGRVRSYGLRRHSQREE